VPRKNLLLETIFCSWKLISGECCCRERCTLGVESLVVFHEDVVLMLENDLKIVNILMLDDEITIRELC
jgi:hypothetical protein